MAKKCNGEEQAEKSIYEEILDWSKNTDRPMWQRDALRRIAQGPIEEKDVNDIFLLCRQEYGLSGPSDSSLAPIPLDEQHLPLSAPSEEDVILSGISDIRNVNTIASEGLVFSSTGLTIIYGVNGAGKSGYARILKSACRARGKKPLIHPNAFRPPAGGSPSAKINYTIGGTPSSYDWKSAAFAPPALRRVSVFDSDCAPAYVEEDNDVAYLPFGLDMLLSLVEVCKKISARLNKEQEVLQRQGPNWFLDEMSLTVADLWLRGLSPETSQADIDARTLFSPREEAERVALIKALNEDSPDKKAAALERQAERYETFSGSLLAISGFLSEEKTAALKSLHDDYKTAAETAALASKRKFSGEGLLPGFGSDAWRALFEAAKQYAEEEAYPGEPFPPERDGARCVLCQQGLDGPARARMKSFSDFLIDTTSTRRDKALKNLNAAKDAMTACRITADENLLKELEADDKAVAAQARAFLSGAQARRDALLAAPVSGAWDGVPALPASGEVPLLKIIEGIKIQAAGFRAAAVPAETARMKKLYLELEGKKWLSNHKKEIEDEVVRRKSLCRLSEAINSAATGAITKKTKALTSKYFSSELKGAFETNYRRIYRKELEVEIGEGRGEAGSAKHGVRLPKLEQGDIKPAEIFSEGEAKAVALASFLAEVSVARHRSAIVLDDPVSSFDQDNISNVARLLAEVARKRQVVVFTHNLFFTRELQEISKKLGIEPTFNYVVHDGRGAGHLSSDEPAEILKVKKRISNMRSKLLEAKTIYETKGHDAYRPLSIEISTYFRITLEKAIEEVLLCGIIERYRRTIHSNNVKDLSKITPPDCELLDRLFSSSSAQFHLQAIDSTVNLPTPAVFEVDINDFADWEKDFRKKQRE